MNKKLFIGLIFWSLFSNLRAQTDVKQASNEFSIGLELRPRTELRHGYRLLPNDTVGAAFLTAQLSRLTLNYKNDKLLLRTSLQDVRFWGETDPRSTGATVQLFEAYAEPKISNTLSVRVGRQRIIYDNERLFSENNWRNNGAVHDAALLRYSLN